MSALTQTLTLANGTSIPQLGFGTWMIDNADASQAVQAALAAGYRHIDTAQDYGNEQGVMLRNPALAKIAAHYGVSVAQLCIRYCLQHGLIALPKTANPAKMRENAAVDFAISAADMAALDALPAIEHYGEVATFPIYGGKKHLDGTYTARCFNRRDEVK